MKDRILVPSKLDLEKIISENPPSEVKGFKIDTAYFLIYQIILQRLKETNNRGGFVNLHSWIQRQWVHNYKQYWKYLERVGIIICDGDYHPGSKSLGYKLSPEYVSKVKYHYITDWTLLRNWNFKNPCKDVSNTFPVYHQTITAASDFIYSNHTAMPDFSSTPVTMKIDWDCDMQISIDPAVYDLIEERYNYDDTNIGSYNHRIVALEKLKNISWTGNISLKCLRLSFWFSQIPKDIRTFILINGERVVEFDLNNSHGFFSLLLLEEWFYKNKEGFCLSGLYQLYKNRLFTGSTIHRMVSTIIKEPSKNTTSTIKLQRILGHLENRDVDLYRMLVLSGSLYCWFANRIREELGEVLPKKKWKRKFFLAIYSSNKFLDQPEAKYKRILIKYLPTVMAVFSIIKRSGKKTLSHFMLLTEAHFFVTEFQFGMIDFDILELHDSVSCPTSQAKEVHEEVCRIIIDKTGLRPSFEQK